MTVEGKLEVTIISARSSQACSRLSCHDSIVEVVYGRDTVWTSSPSKRQGSLLQWGESFSLSTRKDAPDELQLRVKSVGIISHKAVHATIYLKEVFVSGNACPIVQLLSKDGKERGELFLQLNFVSAFKLMRDKAEASDPAASLPAAAATCVQSPSPCKVPGITAAGFQPLGSGMALYHTPQPVPSQCAAPRSNRATATSALRKSIAHRICSPADCAAASMSEIEQQISEDADLARQPSGSAAIDEEQICADAELARKLSGAACMPSGSLAEPSDTLVQPQNSPAADSKDARSNSLAKEFSSDSRAQLQRTAPAKAKAIRSSGTFRPLSASHVGQSSLRSFSSGRRWSSESGTAPDHCSSQENGPRRQSSASGSLEHRKVCSASLGQAAGPACCASAAENSGTIDALPQNVHEARCCRSMPSNIAGGHCATAMAAERRRGQPQETRHLPAVCAAAADKEGATPGHELQYSRGLVEFRCPGAQQLSFREPNVVNLDTRCPARRQLSFWGPDLTCVAEARKELGGLVSGSCKTQLEIDILQATSMREPPSAPPLPEEMWNIMAYR